jgi:hypothetical protein
VIPITASPLFGWIEVMPKSNQKDGLPRLASGGDPWQAGFTLSRRDILSGKIPTFWGPGQYSPDSSSEYLPPNDWPKAGTLLRVPRVVRFFYESVTLGVYVTVAGKFTGSYDYGVHRGSFDLDMIDANPDNSVHVHTTHEEDAGTAQYAIKFTVTMNGSNFYPGLGTYTASGSRSDWYSTLYLPSFLLQDYEDRSSDTYKVIKIIWELLSGGFAPAKPFTSKSGFVDIQYTPDGPNSVGICLPVPTGALEVDGELVATDVDPSTLGMTIPVGWAQPPNLPDVIQAVAVPEFANDRAAFYRRDEASRKPTDIWFDFLHLVSPTTNRFFGTKTIAFLMFSKWHPIPSPDDPRLDAIRKGYEFFSQYQVIILLDMDSFNDILEAASVNGTVITGVISDFFARIRELVDSLTDFGWSIQEVGYKSLDPGVLTSIIHSAFRIDG